MDGALADGTREVSCLTSTGSVVTEVDGALADGTREVSCLTSTAV